MNQTLKSLSLQGINVKEEGVRNIADGLEVNSSVKELDFSGSSIGNSGVLHLARGLSKNTGLVQINLSYNSIEDTGMRHIVDMLEHNKSLTSINLVGNDISGEGVRYLIEFLEKNLRIIKIMFSYYNINKELFDKIDELINRNTLIKQVSRKIPQVKQDLLSLDSRNYAVQRLLQRFEDYQATLTDLTHAQTHILYEVFQKLWDFEKEAEGIILTQEYAKGEVIIQFRELQQKNPELFIYCKAFFWTALNLFYAYRDIPATSLNGPSNVTKYGTEIVEGVALDEDVISGLDQIVENLFTKLKPKSKDSKLSVIQKVIQKKSGQEEDMSIDVGKTALKMTQAKENTILHHQSVQNLGVIPKEIESSKEKIKMEVFASIGLHETSSYAGSLAIDDSILFIEYLCVGKIQNSVEQMKLDSQCEYAVQNGHLVQLLRKVQKAENLKHAHGTCQLF